MAFSFTKGFENYAKFPMHYMRITQNWNKGNHKPHWDGANYKDYPIDIAGMDGGRDYLFAPVDMKVVALNGIGSKSVSNKIFLESVDKVQTVKHGKTKIFMTAVHFEDSDVSKFGLKVGKVFKAGEKICLEGKETATGNHLHFTCGVGSAKTSIENNNGKWVTKGDCKKPEEIFYIDPKFTKVLNKGGASWSNLPKEPIKEEKPVEKKVVKYINTTDGLNLRDKASTTGKVVLTLPLNSEVTIIKDNAGTSNGYKWSEVKYGAKTGYVASKYLSTSKTTITKTVKALLGLAMRETASKKGKKIQTIKYKQKVEIITFDYGKKDGYNWAKIKYNGKTGYVANKYLK